jgi:hypothetical protein
MFTGSLKKIIFAKTAHRLPKLITLGIATSLLVSMVTIDASATSARVGRNSNTLSTALLMKLANETGNREFSGVMKHRGPIKTTTGSTTTTTTPPVLGGGGGTGGGGGGTGGGGGSTTTTTTPAPPSTTTTIAPSTPAASGGPIIAGPSRSECLEAYDPTGASGLATLQAQVASFNQETGSNVTCLLQYLNGAPSWAAWVDPWITQSQFGYTSWVAAAPQTRQLVLQVDLIPDSLKNVNDPLSWEQSCAAGDFNSYATQLGTNLVAAGLQNSVLRLGPEMNGPWEADYIGTTTQEQNLWATCFANEVTGIRQAAGEHFLIDWNPNACTQNEPYANFYPGNAYVDIVGLDLYDVGCDVPGTQLSFSQLSNETYGLTSFESFAAAQGKPMSFPEWGLATTNGDDPAYINGIGSTVASNDFAFEAYFDAGAGFSVPLGSGTPLSLVAFQKWFGNS